MKRKRLKASEYIDGIISQNRVILSQAITVIESRNDQDIALGQEILAKIATLKQASSVRLGITGVPGVGKSTFINKFGKHITGLGLKLAVLSIDPSSQRSKGSILGDKTRMSELATDQLAFIRPSPSGNSLGGVANKTREAMILCEATGYDVIIIETVGVGQSETAVKNMVDFFLLLALAGGGDELQGIKRGIMEMADAIAINKADGDNIKAAKQAKREFQNALHLFPPSENNWIPKVLLCSAEVGSGLKEIWGLVKEFERLTTTNGSLAQNRIDQNIDWFYDLLKNQLIDNIYKDDQIKSMIDQSISDIKKQKTDPSSAVSQIIKSYTIH